MDAAEMQARCSDLLRNTSEFQNGFPYLQMKPLRQWFDLNILLEDRNLFWKTLYCEWLDMIGRNLEGSYRIVESKRFLLLSSEDDKLNQQLLSFAEKSFEKIRGFLQNLVQKIDNAKLVLLLISAPEDYWRYISYFYPEEGEAAQHAACFIFQGYRHIALSNMDNARLEAALFHELVHFCLYHAPLPLWLTEGLTEHICITHGYSEPVQLDAEAAQRHWSYWNEETIQAFWSGESFFWPDEGSWLSSQLAVILLQLIMADVARNPEEFANFILEAATHGDAGEQAAQIHLHISLDAIASTFLGEGNRAPATTEDEGSGQA